MLHVIGSVDPTEGGTTDHVFSSCRIWSRRGHECNILCLDAPDAAWINLSPVVTFALGRRGSRHNFARRFVPWYRYGYTPDLVKWLKGHAEHYDAIILNGLWNYTSYGTWRALRKLKVPYFICPHGMLDPWFKDAYPLKYLIKKVFFNLFEWHVLRDTGGIFFACEEEMRLANDAYSQYIRHGHVVHYGTQDIAGDKNAQKSAFVSRFPRLQDRKFILFLSRIHPKKGLDLLINAFARCAKDFSEFDLVIAGPDKIGLKPNLQKIAVNLGIDDRIHWPGMLSGDEKWGAFRSAEFFALPSHQENFGIVVAEAMALGLPVLISDKVNIWREIQSDGAGHVVRDQLDDIADGLRYMCAKTRPQLQLMGANSRNCYLKRFNLENNAIELLDLMISRISDIRIVDSRTAV